MERGRYWENINFPESNVNSLSKYEANLDEELKNECAIWRIIHEKMATLKELENTWCFDDLLRATSYLNMKEDLNYCIQLKSREKS